MPPIVCPLAENNWYVSVGPSMAAALGGRTRGNLASCFRFGSGANTLALGGRLATMHGVREYVEAGGLMSYGANGANMAKWLADPRL